MQFQISKVLGQFDALLTKDSWSIKLVSKKKNMLSWSPDLKTKQRQLLGAGEQCKDSRYQIILFKNDASLWYEACAA